MREVLSLLQASGQSFLSGETMSRQLGITRAAVWKQIKRLRESGYEIEAVTNLGYRLVREPETLDRQKIRADLAGHPWSQLITVLDTVDSTNNYAKRQALLGAPSGSVYVSDEQTGGRGRQGRQFLSPKGRGIYLTVLLRPGCGPAELAHLTAMAAVAACNAVERVCQIRPEIKWTNDLILEGKKCAGILSEMSVEWESSTLEYVVVGIGINCTHTPEDFPEALREKAASIAMVTGQEVNRNELTAELIRQFCRMSEELLSGKEQWMQQYAKDCLTLGKQVRIVRGNTTRTGTATGIDENGALIVRFDSGETGVVFSGEVSVRGVNGYL